jgi:hypothetical protein
LKVSQAPSFVDLRHNYKLHQGEGLPSYMSGFVAIAIGLAISMAAVLVITYVALTSGSLGI